MYIFAFGTQLSDFSVPELSILGPHPSHWLDLVKLCRLSQTTASGVKFVSKHNSGSNVSCGGVAAGSHAFHRMFSEGPGKSPRVLGRFPKLPEGSLRKSPKVLEAFQESLQFLGFPRRSLKLSKALRRSAVVQVHSCMSSWRLFLERKRVLRPFPESAVWLAHQGGPAPMAELEATSRKGC